jgi:hypothetical protein
MGGNSSKYKPISYGTISIETPDGIHFALGSVIRGQVNFTLNDTYASPSLIVELYGTEKVKFTIDDDEYKDKH